MIMTKRVSGVTTPPPQGNGDQSEAVAAEAQVLQPYGVGVDCHSKFIAVCVLYQRRNKVLRREQSFGVSWPELEKARDWIVSIVGNKYSEHLRYCIESTGTYHMPVLIAFRGKPTVVNPTLASPTRRKTDVLDARLLAHHSITGMWPESFVPSGDGIVLRVLWAARNEAVRAATRASNRLNNIILRFGHTLGAVASVRSEENKMLLRSMVEGVVPDVPNVSPLGLPEAVRPVVAELVADTERFRDKAREAQNEALLFVQSRRWPTASRSIKGGDLLPLLMTVPGVGMITALTWLSEVIDPRRFLNDRQVAAYAGCDPSLKVSAGKVTEYARRKGNERLHKALNYAASSLLRDPRSPLASWGLSIAGRHKKGGYRKAIGAVSRRIGVGLWHVHRKGEPFDMSGYHFDRKPSFDEAPKESIGLSPRQLSLLPEGLESAGDIAAAFQAGRLGAVRGLGEGAFEKIKLWAASHSSHKHIYHLKPRELTTNNEKRQTNGPAAGRQNSRSKAPRNQER